MGEVDVDLGIFLAVVHPNTGLHARDGYATDYLASSVADFVKNLFVGRFRLRCDDDRSTLEGEDAQWRVLREDSSASNALAERAIRTLGEQLRTLRYGHSEPLQNASYAKNLATNGWIFSFCVTRYACGAGGITPLRVAYDTTSPFCVTVLFKIFALEHRGLSSGKISSMSWTLRESRGSGQAKSETNPEHIV